MEKALAYAPNATAAHGAHVEPFGGAHLILPLYAPETPERTGDAKALAAVLHAADGVLIASPGHGTLSGLVKNALDYMEDMAKDADVYFLLKAVRLIACAHGWQATGSSL